MASLIGKTYPSIEYLHACALQAWQLYCKDRHSCRGRPPTPDKACVINLPNNAKKSEVLLPRLQQLGLRTEIVEGILSDQVESSLCHQISRTSSFLSPYGSLIADLVRRCMIRQAETPWPQPTEADLEAELESSQIGDLKTYTECHPAR